MRTRIALVAIIPVALITTLVQAVTVQSAHAIPVPVPSSVTKTSTPSASTLTYRPLKADGPMLDPSSLLVDLGATLAHPPTATALPFTASATPATPVVAAVAVAAQAPAPAAGPVDTVTPGQRAAWERVAMCEEGGNWASNGPRFSGGLGITRSNWYAYGGGQYAPEAAEATPDQQIMVAERIQYDPPDQYGCGSW